MFWPNVKKRITAVAVQLAHARKPGISNTAKSSYYRSATLLYYTIVEGAVFELAKKHTAPHYLIDEVKKFKEVHKLPKHISGTLTELYICEKIKEEIHIQDSGVTFGRLNLFLKHKGIISTEEYKKLEYIRKERNKLHLQGLNSLDIGYTKNKFNRTADSLNFLLKKL